uniref:Uncharacterized protein n=1 Tax=Arundo donax TaxID=35708 RepID=A0A0A8Z4F7_ARUDO
MEAKGSALRDPEVVKVVESVLP